MFINRDVELKILNNLFSLKKASLVVCKGRRRIGKSKLLEEFGKSAKQFIEIQGLAPRDNITKNDQLSAFSMQLSKCTRLPYLTITSWSQAFSLLNSIISDQKTVILLDEISWMSAGDKDFAGILKLAWDTELKMHDKLILVLCGSVSSWIDNNILNNTGFRGRVSVSLTLDELSLHSCNLFWSKANNKISDMEKFKILAVTGGVPKYLEEINIKKTAEENIKSLCFQKQGYLFNEYDEIFKDTFNQRSATYEKIVEKLCLGAKTVNEIASCIEWKSGGTISSYLNDLKDSGFIEKSIMYAPGKKKPLRIIKYRLKDNYLRFYLKYIKDKKEKIEKNLYQHVALENLPEWEIVLGFQFENLVLNNIQSVCLILDIDLSIIKSAAPFYQKKTKQKAGCQIDLLIETNYSLYVCEIKFQKLIKADIIKKVNEKILKLQYPKYLSVRPVLIYAGELEEKINKEDYFTKIIDFGQLLK